MQNQTQSPANILGTNVITQIGILVHDIEKTAQAYADFLAWRSRRATGQIQLTLPGRNIGASRPRHAPYWPF